jgi:hypothetical protein
VTTTVPAATSEIVVCFSDGMVTPSFTFLEATTATVLAQGAGHDCGASELNPDLTRIATVNTVNGSDVAGYTDVGTKAFVPVSPVPPVAGSGDFTSSPKGPNIYGVAFKPGTNTLYWISSPVNASTTYRVTGSDGTTRAFTPDTSQQCHQPNGLWFTATGVPVVPCSAGQDAGPTETLNGSVITNPVDGPLSPSTLPPSSLPANTLTAATNLIKNSADTSYVFGASDATGAYFFIQSGPGAIPTKIGPLPAAVAADGLVPSSGGFGANIVWFGPGHTAGRN